jgi:TRAP-type C4-dicarboxylate transport system substrate-binding protein
MKARNGVLALLLSVIVPVAGLPVFAGAPASALTFRMAANVPANSPWDLGLKRLAAEFDRVSGGRVKIVFPQSAHVSTESDIIQKMRFGVDGALLTTFGLAELYPDSLALSMPSFIRDDAEFDAVLGAVEPLIKSKLGERYTVLAISKGGWIRYFSKTPIIYPSDLSRLRISIDPSNDKVIQLMESVGARTVKGTTADFLLQVNSNTVDATCVSPIYIASLWSQLRGKIAYMSGFKVAPFIGSIVFNKSSWDKVPADLSPLLEQVVRDMARQIGLDSAKLESEAIASLDGIQTPPEPPDAAEKWAELIAQRRHGLIAQLFSPDMLDTMDSALAAVRKSK